MLPLSDAVAVVTGASSSIGATSSSLAYAGAEIILAARHEDRLEALRVEIEAPEHVDVSEVLQMPSGQWG